MKASGAEAAAPATRQDCLAAAAACFDQGHFVRRLAAWVAVRTESQNPDAAPALHAYLERHLASRLQELGFTCQIFANPAGPAAASGPQPGPLMVATRHEADHLPTVLMYGHGDVIRGQDTSWTKGQGPWVLSTDGDRLYGRGSADNKGQHCINIEALACVLRLRGGQLGFNVKWLFETGEETGSPGLAEFCRAHTAELAADALLASDGPRISQHRPTVFLGSRGVANFDLSLKLREGAHHSGNWGGLLRNPGTVLAHAICSLVDAHGVIRVPALRAPPLPANVRAALADLHFGGDAGDPQVDTQWGEPGYSPAERVIASNTLEVLAYTTGNPQHPVNAIPATARAHMHMRYVVGTPIDQLHPIISGHLAREGYADIEISQPRVMAATRLDPDNPWVHFTLESMERSCGIKPALLPNLGGSLPNDVFADILSLPTVWIPHSYAACGQHAPDEHLLAPVARQALQIMAGLYWDLGADGGRLPRRQR